MVIHKHQIEIPHHLRNKFRHLQQTNILPYTGTSTGPKSEIKTEFGVAVERTFVQETFRLEFSRVGDVFGVISNGPGTTTDSSLFFFSYVRKGYLRKDEWYLH